METELPYVDFRYFEPEKPPFFSSTESEITRAVADYPGLLRSRDTPRLAVIARCADMLREALDAFRASPTPETTIRLALRINGKWLREAAYQQVWLPASLLEIAARRLALKEGLVLNTDVPLDVIAEIQHRRVEAGLSALTLERPAVVVANDAGEDDEDDLLVHKPAGGASAPDALSDVAGVGVVPAEGPAAASSPATPAEETATSAEVTGATPEPEPSSSGVMGRIRRLANWVLG